LFSKIQEYLIQNLDVLDYGCGTASLYFNQLCKVKNVTLVDVENIAFQYVSSKINNRPNFIQLNLEQFEKNQSTYDLIFCIDVLEHLSHSGEVFFNLDKKLRVGGVFILQMPWGGIPEHIPEALENWIESGAQKYLTDNYQKLETINPFILVKPNCISGIYRKVN
jgi:SAM-dependent methyltransferase